MDGAWLAWATATAVSFAALEAYALYSKRGDHPTLSATFRRVVGIEPWKWYGAIARFGLVAFAAWLVLHLGFGLLP